MIAFKKTRTSELATAERALAEAIRRADIVAVRYWRQIVHQLR